MSDQRRKRIGNPSKSVDSNDASEADGEAADIPIDPSVLRTADDYAIPKVQAGEIPPWVKVPADLRLPSGRNVIYLRFRAELTDTPQKGERQVILWPISVGDKKMALSRSQGDAQRLSDEIAKQMIRAIDGLVTDWTGQPGPANVDLFWEDIGERSRTMIQRMFVQLHVPNREEIRDFFENCVVVRTAV